MRKYILAFFGLALLLSACRIESNIMLDISEDGSATVGAEVGFDQEMLDLVSQGGGDPSEILDELPDLGGDGVEPINRTEGDMTYFGAQTNIADLSTYDFDGLEGETFSEFSYEFDKRSASLAATVDATGMGDLGGEDLLLDPSEITGDIFSARVLVKMPGTVSESNADEILPDGTLVWDLPFTGSKEIVATSTYGASAISWIWFVVGGILIVGIIAAIAAVLMSKKDSEKAVAEAAAASAPEADAEKEPSAISSQPVEEELSAISSQPSAEEQAEELSGEEKPPVEEIDEQGSEDDPPAES